MDDLGGKKPLFLERPIYKWLAIRFLGGVLRLPYEGGRRLGQDFTLHHALGPAARLRNGDRWFLVERVDGERMVKGLVSNWYVKLYI